jgi:FkbM family methyltransferase
MSTSSSKQAEAAPSKVKRILLDVGANRGLFTDANLALGQFDLAVLVEASPRMAIDLRSKYKNDPRVVVLNRIASSDAGPVTFYECSTDTISSASLDWQTIGRFAGQGRTWTPRTDVGTVTLDAIVAQFGTPTYTKIDVEGYELSVLKSLSKHIGPLCFEWSEEIKDELVKSLDYVAGIGYNRFYVEDGSDRYDFRPADNQFVPLSTVMAFVAQLQPQRRHKFGMIHCR